MDYSELRNWAEFVINYSLEMAGLTLENDYLINQRLLNYENSVFENNKNVQELLNNKINYKACLSYIDEKSPKNLLWLKNLEISSDIRKSRFDNSLRFPVEKS